MKPFFSMKNAWMVLCGVGLAFPQIALGDGQNAGAPLSPLTVVSDGAALRAAWTVSDAPTRRIKEAGLPNFGKLNEHLWRSGQPNRAGYQRLTQMGVKTVVNLREEFPGDKEMIPQGVRYVYIPIKDERAPTDEQAKQFLEIAANPDNWPILVHCHEGEGRAGVMAALIRHSFDAWDHSKLMKEVGNFRSKPLGFITVRMAGVQQAFIKHWEETTPAGGSLSIVAAH